MNVFFANGNNQVMGKVQHVCNATNGWQQITVDLTPLIAKYAGQNVTLVFSAKTGQAAFATTAFYVDDVTVTFS